MSRHATLTAVQGIHTVVAFIYADAAERTAATGFAAEDVGKFAYQEDDESFWILQNHTGPTWFSMGGTPVDLSDATPVGITAGGKAGPGVDTEASRSDHVHAISTAKASSIGSANDEGVASSLARSDHVHDLPFSVVATVLAAASTSVGFNNQKLTSVADPTLAQDVATKAYVDALIQGLDVKGSVTALITSNVAALTGLAEVSDGVTLNADGMIALLVGQSTASQNGPWVLHSGAWTRPTNFPTGGSAAGSFFFVEQGTTYADTGWVCTTNAANDVIGTNNLAFVQFSAAGQVVAGAGLTKTGNTIDVIANADGSIVVNANDIQVGVLATDAQHGNRGGGALHADVTSKAAGFMLAADKVKLDALTPGSTGNIPFNGGKGSFSADSKLSYDDSTDQLLAPGATFTEDLILSAELSPSQITSNQTDYNPTNLATATTLRINSDAARSIFSLSGQATGRLIIIHNVGSFPITLKNDDGATGTAAMRFLFGQDYAIQAGGGLALRYDGTSSRWRWVATTGGAASVKFEIAFRASDYEAISNGSPSLIDRGSTGHKVVGFADAATTGLIFRGRIPSSYSGGGLDVVVNGISTTATTGNVRLSVSFERLDSGGQDYDSDGFASATAATVAAAASSGVPFTSTINFANGSAMDSLAAGDAFRIKVERLGSDGADTMTDVYCLDSVVVKDVVVATVGGITLSSANGAELGTAAPGTSSVVAREDHVHPTTITNKTSENVTYNLAADDGNAASLATATAATRDVALTVSRHYDISAKVVVEDGSTDVVYMKALYVEAHRKSSGDAIICINQAIHDAYSAVAFTFVATVSTSNVRFTLTNSSGSTRNYNIIITYSSHDKP